MKAYTMGIRILGEKVQDDEARIVCLMVLGLSYEVISACLYINPRMIRNHVSNLYGLLDIECEQRALVCAAISSGFDYKFCCNGKCLLTKAELERVRKHCKADLLTRMAGIIITLPPKK